MGLIGLIMLFVLFLALVFIVVGITLYRKRNNTPNKPTLLGFSALFLQLLLILLFFSEVFVNMNEKIVDILWWGTVLYGLIIGMKEVKNNIFVSLLSIFLSILLAIFMALMTFITSM